MKKALFATTALVLSAGVAAADVTISGYGRTGVIYQENDAPGAQETQIISRLRMNIDASTTTDQGVDFGARFRLQWDQNNASRGDGGTTNAGKLYVTANGLTVEVGNVDTAADSVGLRGATELGAFDRSVGFSDVDGTFFAYESSKYDNVNRVGVRVLYEIDNLILQASYVNPDQTDGTSDEEIALAVDYTWNDRLELAAAYANNAGGVDGVDEYFIGARYAVNEQARIGLNFADSDDEGMGTTVAIYGDYTLADGLTNIEAYIANNDRDFNETDNAFGIGVNYDLGGARLGASIQRDYNEDVTADLGVRFDF